MSELRMARIYRRVARVAASLNGRFTTEEFVREFSRRFPLSWRYLVRKYAPGGKGAGQPYSAASRVSGMLRRMANRKQIRRHKYVAATPAWGSPWVRTWQS